MSTNRRTIEIVLATTVIAATLLFIFSREEQEIVTVRPPPSAPIVVTVSGEKNGFNRPSRFLVESYQKQAKERREKLAQIKKTDSDWGFALLYNNLAPEAYCSEKMKVGTTDDGGKWMCSPQKLPHGCVIFSLGIAGVITFERDIQMYSNQACRIISADWGKQKPEVIQAMEAIGGVVVEAQIGPENNATTRTMESILQENGASSVEILKMDIEGAELETMEKFLGSYTPAQIMVEAHGTPSQVIDFLQMIASKGYYLVHYEINGRWHILAEYAFIHESKLEYYGATVLASYLKP